jgi:hypothetical protein
VKRTGHAIRITLAATACLLAVGCGEAGGVSGIGPPAAHAGRSSELGERRFKLLDAVYVAALALDRVQPPNVSTTALRGAARRATATVGVSCKAMDPHDALLGPLRRACLATFDVAAPPPCPAREPLKSTGARGAPNVFTGSGCPAAFRQLDSELESGIRLDRAADRAVGAADISAACKAAIIHPPAVYALDRASHALFTLVSRRATTAPQSGPAVQDETDEISTVERTVPTNRELLERFRSGCA